MNKDMRRFAPIGLYLALAAAVVSASLYLVQRDWNIYLQISLALIVVGLALFAYLDPDQVRRLLTGRQARYGSNVLVLTLAFLGILLVINYLAFNNPKTWDLTEDAQFTLASESVETLQALPQPVQALAFYSEADNPDTARLLLDRYQQSAKDKFSVEFIDPDANPIAAGDLGVPLDPGGTVVLKMGDRVEKVTFLSEREVTGALVRLMSEKQNVYFLTGHGEYSPDESSDTGYSAVKAALSSKSYEVALLNLVADRQVPEDADIIVVAGARVPVTEAEVAMIAQFLDGGGGLIVLSEPLPLTDFGSQPDLLGDYLASHWNIDLGDDLVIDTSDQQQPFFAYVAEYSSDLPITQALQEQRLSALFPTSRSVRAMNTVGDVQAVELMFTVPDTMFTQSRVSWAESNLAGIANNEIPEPNEGEDIIGRVPLGVAATNTSTGARVVTVGDADFAINAYFDALGNGDFLINSIDWAAEQENIINLTPKEQTQRILVPPTTMTAGLILLGSVFIPALLVLVMGIVVAVQRRARG